MTDTLIVDRVKTTSSMTRSLDVDENAPASLIRWPMADVSGRQTREGSAQGDLFPVEAALYEESTASESQTDSPAEVALRFDTSLFALGAVVKHHSSLTNKRKTLLSRLWTIVLSKALQAGLSPRGVVDVEEAPDEEGPSRPVLRVYLDVGGPQALAFWDGLDVDLGRWLSHLDAASRQTVMRDIGLRVHWNVAQT